MNVFSVIQFNTTTSSERITALIHSVSDRKKDGNSVGATKSEKFLSVRQKMKDGVLTVVTNETGTISFLSAH